MKNKLKIWLKFMLIMIASLLVGYCIYVGNSLWEKHLR